MHEHTDAHCTMRTMAVCALTYQTRAWSGIIRSRPVCPLSCHMWVLAMQCRLVSGHDALLILLAVCGLSGFGMCVFRIPVRHASARKRDKER